MSDDTNRIEIDPEVMERVSTRMMDEIEDLLEEAREGVKFFHLRKRDSGVIGEFYLIVIYARVFGCSVHETLKDFHPEISEKKEKP